MRKTQEEIKSELIKRRDAYYKRKKIIKKKVALSCISMVVIVVIFAGIRAIPVSNLNNSSSYLDTDNTKEKNVNINDKNTNATTENTATTVSENKSNSKETDSTDEDYDEEFDDYDDFDEFYDDSYYGSANGFSAGGSNNSENTDKCISIDIKSTDNNKIIQQFTDNLKIKKILNSIDYMCWHSTETNGMDSPNLSGYIITLNYQSNYTESYTYYENKYYIDNYGLCYEINRESNPTLKEIIENLLPD